MTGDSLSRRAALTSAGLALSAPSSASTASGSPMIVRVIGTAAPDGRRSTPIDGRISMISSSGHAMPAFGFRGVVETQLTSIETQLVFRRTWRASLTGLDGEFLPDRVRNPVTGRRVSVPTIAAETTCRLALADIEAQCRCFGPFVMFDFEEPGPAALATTFSQSFIAIRGQLNDPTRDAVEACGTLRAAAPWPAWLDMGEAPGHMAIDGRFGATTFAES